MLFFAAGGPGRPQWRKRLFPPAFSALRHDAHSCAPLRRHE